MPTSEGTTTVPNDAAATPNYQLGEFDGTNFWFPRIGSDWSIFTQATVAVAATATLTISPALPGQLTGNPNLNVLFDARYAEVSIFNSGPQAISGVTLQFTQTVNGIAQTIQYVVPMGGVTIPATTGKATFPVPLNQGILNSMSVIVTWAVTPAASGNVGALVKLSDEEVTTPRGYPSAPAAATSTANADTAVAFSTRVNHVMVQNNTANDIYIDFDIAATQGSICVPKGQSSWFSDNQCSTLHIYTTVASSVNGTASGGIVVRGWL